MTTLYKPPFDTDCHRISTDAYKQDLYRLSAKITDNNDTIRYGKVIYSRAAQEVGQNGEALPMLSFGRHLRRRGPGGIVRRVEGAILRQVEPDNEAGRRESDVGPSPQS